jgi:hypothetical protein
MPMSAEKVFATGARVMTAVLGRSTASAASIDMIAIATVPFRYCRGLEMRWFILSLLHPCRCKLPTSRVCDIC